jgi:hypothetical protein
VVAAGCRPSLVILLSRSTSARISATECWSLIRARSFVLPEQAIHYVSTCNRCVRRMGDSVTNDIAGDRIADVLAGLGSGPQRHRSVGGIVEGMNIFL